MEERFYRLFTLNEAGRVCGSRECNSICDEEAIQEARRLSVERKLDVEVWEGARKVQLIRANSKDAAI